MPEQAALLAEGITFRYFPEGKRNILEDVSVGFPEGKITVLTGASGCGKSTLAAVCAGLYPENAGCLASGRVMLFGEDIREISVSRRAGLLSMMFQNPDLQFCMETLREELRFCLENISCPPEEMDGRLQKAAELMQTGELLDRRLTSLSGGEKQKAVLTCIFLLESKIILLDEPFANIDAKWAEQIAGMLETLNRERGTTVIAVDHSLEHWLGRAHGIMVMTREGRILPAFAPDRLPEYRELFREEGLRYPEEPARSRVLPDGGDPAAELVRADIYPVKKLRRKDPEQPVLRDVNAVFRKGQMTAVFGPSGSGKTTLFLALLKQRYSTGEIRTEEGPLASRKEKEVFSEIGIVFQNPSHQFITQNVWEEVAGKTEENEEALALLTEFGLERFRKYSPYMLSQGQQRRLAVLAILMSRQKILLLDEPTYGQDDAMTQMIMRLLKKKAEDDGLTVVFSSHDTRLIRQWADAAWEIRDGKVTEADPASAGVVPGGEGSVW